MSKIDYSKIFIKDACPTAIGGQAIMEGVMMQGPDRLAIAMRMPSGELYLRTKKKPAPKKASKVPLVRGVVAFVQSLVTGMGTLMESADILEAYAPELYAEEPGKLETWMNNKFGEKAAWNIAMTVSVIIAIAITIVGFVIFPTWVVNFLSKSISNVVVLNLIEGLLRILLFVLYVLAIRKMQDIKKLFQYHGAEHKSIHCFENGLELTPDNADGFYTLHPRCGTSFLVFVLIISLLLFSFLGWPNLLWRILSRLLLLPVIAGISYELLKWAGRCDGALVKILSYPGLMLQKLTTDEPDKAQLEVALLSLKAVLVDPATPTIEGFVDADGNLLDTFNEDDFLRRTLQNKPKEEPEKIEEVTAESLADRLPSTFDKIENTIVGVFAPEEEPIDLTKKDESSEPESSDELEMSLTQELAMNVLEELEGTKVLTADEAAKIAASMGDAPSAKSVSMEKRATLAEALSEKERIVLEAAANKLENVPATIKDALKWGQDQLDSIENGRLDATKIFQHLTGLSTSRIITQGGAGFDEQCYRDYKKMIEERLSGVPMQYIVGVQSFMGNDFRVNPSVLIPRYDTEVLAEKTINIIGHKKWLAPEVLDMCTGSGALGVTIARRYPEASVTLSDVSQDALNVAAGNAQLNGVRRNCQFLIGDMFKALPEGKQFDVIVCNPPYIQTDVIGTLATEVKDHEPMMALDGGTDGLNFYRTIAAEAGAFLKKGGILALEIGADQDAAVQKLLKDSGDYAAVIGFKDLNGLDRVVIAEKK